MSWKLAELRWRQHVGLNEKCREREQEAPEDDHGGILRNGGHLQRQRGRSYPVPSSRVVEQSELSGHSLPRAIRSHPTLLAFSSDPSTSSLTPLLKTTQSGVNIIADSYSSRWYSEQDIEQWGLSLSRQQTPFATTSFPHDGSCPQFDGMQSFLSPREDCPVSSEVATPSLAFSARSHDGRAAVLPRTPQQPLSASASEAQSLFQFELPRTPSFGLHFAQHNRTHQGRSGRNLVSDGPVPWSQGQSFSPTIRPTSLDSRHHSDSALLQNASMDSQSCYSSPDRRSTRPLYPDLPSAYAEIQGRRTASLQHASSSRSATRFPLSPSTSSSDEEPPVTLSLGDDAIPLRSLPCRNVRSAHVVLHEADHHPESSAIFETSDENSEPSRKRSRASTTLEDIVSQYADASTANSSSLDDRVCVEGASGMPRPASRNGEILNMVEDPFRSESVQLSTSGSAQELYRLYQQKDENVTFPAREGVDDIGDDDEWETVPESSRVRFITPSKLRFRLRKRNSVETSTSGVTGRSPPSPWDPLSNSTQTKQAKLRPRPQFHHKDHLRSSRTQPLSDELRYRDDSADGNHPGTRHPWSTVVQEQNQYTKRQPRRSETARAHVPGPVRSSTQIPQAEKRATPTQINSSSRPEHPSVHSTNRALASSSLLQRPLDNMFASSFSSTPATATSPEASRARGSHPTFGLPSLSEEQSNTSFERNFGSANVSPTPNITRKAQDPIYRSVEDGAPVTNLGVHTQRVHPELSASSNFRTPRALHSETLLAQHLYEGGYSLDDRDLSRFLRDSRRLRHGLETRQEFVTKHGLFGRRNVRVTGSSLANISSDSSSVSRVYLADAAPSGMNHSELDNLTTTLSRPVRRFIQSLTRTDKNTEGHGLQYASLASVQSSDNSVVGLAFLVCNEAGISIDGRGVQRRAGTILLAFGVLAYLPGGWMLIHSMGKGGPLATTAMAELTRMLEGKEERVVCCVHPMDAAMARAIERAVVMLVVVGVFCWLAVLLWSAATF